jgi:hypothetical protein
MSRVKLHGLEDFVYNTISHITMYKVQNEDDDSIRKRALKVSTATETIKISADEQQRIMRFAFIGIIDMDVMQIFKKLYPRNESNKGSSLNYFLKMEKLESKEDMEYTRMFKIHALSRKLKHMPWPATFDKNDYPPDSPEYQKLQNAEDMFEVAKYGVVSNSWSSAKLLMNVLTWPIFHS